jgi:hypothetical protein
MSWYLLRIFEASFVTVRTRTTSGNKNEQDEQEERKTRSKFSKWTATFFSIHKRVLTLHIHLVVSLVVSPSLCLRSAPRGFAPVPRPSEAEWSATASLTIQFTIQLSPDLCLSQRWILLTLYVIYNIMWPQYMCNIKRKIRRNRCVHCVHTIQDSSWSMLFAEGHTLYWFPSSPSLQLELKESQTPPGTSRNIQLIYSPKWWSSWPQHIPWYPEVN